MIEQAHTREPDHRGGSILRQSFLPYVNLASHIPPVVSVLAIKWSVGQEMPGRLWSAQLIYVGGPCVDTGLFFF
jgi:hypothetical protein